MPITLERKLPIILLIVLVMMAATGYFSYQNTQNLKEAVKSEKHTQVVLIKLDEVMIAMLDIETGMRGYLITGDEQLLEPYTRGKKELEAGLPILRDLIKDNDLQTQRLNELEKAIAERVEDADQKVTYRRSGGINDLLSKFGTVTGRVKMDVVRDRVTTLKDEEKSLLAKREDTLNANLATTSWIIGGISVIGILALGLANLVVYLEIKKRRKAEEALREVNKDLEKRVEERTAELAAANKSLNASEFFQRAVIDSLPAHIAVLDKEGNILLVNDAWERFARENVDSPDQLIGTGVGQNYLSICVSEGDHADILHINKNLKDVLDGKLATFTVEYPCHSNTEERWFLMQVNALHADTGGLVISHYNITDRVKAEQSVRFSEEFNRSIVENSPDCVKVLTLEGAMLSMNYPGMCLMEIDDFDPFVGRQWSDNWQGDAEGHRQAIAAVEKARGGETAFFEGPAPTAKGMPKWWEVSVAPVMNELGKPNRLLVVSREITARKKAESEREDLLRREQVARHEAEVANRLRDEFMATVSHELRTPLNSILGWARLLKGGMLDEAVSSKAVDTIIKSSETQNRLIEDLLDVARLISGKIELDITTIKLAELVSGSIEVVRPSADTRNIALQLDIDPVCMEAKIQGDVNRLQQILWNLLTNAIKFSPQGGAVDVKVLSCDENIEIEVSDGGIGINSEFLPFVFERFRQDTSNIEKRSGLGLGLAIVRHLVELHGGTVRAHSDGENKGSAFTVTLPAG